MELRTARIFVQDLLGAAHFYEEMLGLPLRAGATEQGYCVFEAGPVSLVVEQVGADAPAEDQVLTGLSFDVVDIQASYKALSSAGVACTGLPERQAWGGTLATFSDPAGNGLQLVQQPSR